MIGQIGQAAALTSQALPFRLSRRKLIGSNAPCRCSPTKSWSSTRPLALTVLMRNVRSSRLRPGISSARNVTCISGRAQATIVGSGAAFFFLLNIGIGFLLFLMLRSAADRIELGITLFRAVLSRSGCRRLSDRLKYLRFFFFWLSTLHRVESIAEWPGEHSPEKGPFVLLLLLIKSEY